MQSDELALFSDVDFLGDPFTQSTSNDASNTRSKFLPKSKNRKLSKVPDVVQGNSTSSNTSSSIPSTSLVSETNPSLSGNAPLSTNGSNIDKEAPTLASNLEFMEDDSFKHSSPVDPSLLTAEDPENGFPESGSLLTEKNIDSARDHGFMDGEEDVDLSTFSSLDDTLTQPLSSLAYSSGKFYPKLSSRRMDQQLEYLPSTRDSVHLDTDTVLPECSNQTSGLQLHVDSSAGNSSSENGLLTQPKHTKRVGFLTESLVRGVGERNVSENAEEAPRKSSRLRGKIQENVFTNDEDEEDACNDQSGNQSASIDGETGMNDCNDSEYMRETGRHGNTSKATKLPLDETEKSTRKRKPSSGEKAPVKKKFPHSTRRTRRQVDKKLLETPEEEIDVRKLPLKDLILLTEARERMSVKAGATEHPQDNRSSHRNFNYDTYDENGNMVESDYNNDDEEAIHNANVASTKLNYHTYMIRSPSSRWTKMETEMFYQAIRQFGTDFTMIQQLFPGRTRHQVRLKFKNEERKHPLQIADAITHPSKDCSHFEEVIQRLQAQAEEEARKENEMDGEEAESEDATGAPEGSEMKKSDGEEQDANEKDDYNPAKSDDYDDTFYWDEIRNGYTGKDGFDDTYY